MISYFLVILLLVLGVSVYLFGPSYFRNLSLLKTSLFAGFLFLCALVFLVNYYLRGEANTFALLEQEEQYLELVPKYLRGENLPNAESIEAKSFIRAFQRYLQENSDDHQAWMALGNILASAGLGEASLTAYERAYRLQSTNIEIAIAFVNARLSLAKAQGNGELDLLVIEVLENVLRLFPDHGNALMLMGAAGFQGGDYQLAVNSWVKVKKLFELREQQTGEKTPEEVMSALDSSISRAESLNRGEVQKADESDFSQEIEIALSSGLSAELNQIKQQNRGLTLFVFVRSANAAASPMPLAAIRKPVDETWVFPLKIKLDNSHSLMGKDLASVGALSVGAKLSLEGNATKSESDLESEKVIFNPDDSKGIIRLEIK